MTMSSRSGEAARWQLEAEAPAGRGTTARRHRLANGLGLITVVDRRAPIVALQTWCRVGSRHERPGATGMGPGVHPIDAVTHPYRPTRH
jgi:hypothetical protein